MKKGTNLIFFGMLSMLIGTAFASPLLVSELEVRPYSKPLPKGLTADIDVDVVYSNFSIGDSDEDFIDISYFVVLNITNNCDDWAGIRIAQFSTAQNVTVGEIPPDSIFFGENWTNSIGWESEAALVDGEWYNLTWIPPGWREPTTEGYWWAGVQLKDKAVGAAHGGNLTNIYMNMNGTWVDVTGRVKWLDDEGNLIDILPERLPSGSRAVTFSYEYFGEMKIFVTTPTNSSDDSDTGSRLTVETYVPIEFNHNWEPHQSRLIVLSNNRKVSSKLLEPSKIEALKTEPVTFFVSVHSHLTDAIGVFDSSSVAEEIKEIQFEATDDGYLYNTILSDNQMFVMDSFGVEVFIEPRS
jgi:hypothetical protein